MSELQPELLKFFVISIDVVWIINNYQVFLVCVDCGHCPVEGPRDHNLVINHHELVVHVSIRSVVHTHRYVLL